MKMRTADTTIRGAVYGALVGDALGVPVEFSSREKRDADPVREMRAYGTWSQPAGTWSDDGALILCSLEALADSAGFDSERMGKLFVDWMLHAHWTARGERFDIGNATFGALSRIASGVSAEQAGGTSERDNGNGSLMRILPMALRFAHTTTPAELALLAMRASAITHGHIRSKLACAFYCILARRLLIMRDACTSIHIAQAVADAICDFAPILEAHPNERAAFARIMDGDIATAARNTINSGGYVVSTLEAALWCLLQHDTFAETVLAAVNLGEDTDTTGCVAAGLAGIIYGFDAIPSEWLGALPRGDEIDLLLKRFTAKLQIA